MTRELYEELGRCAFRDANDAFLVVHPRELRVLQVNPAALRLTELQREELLGLRLEELIVGDSDQDTAALEHACGSESDLTRAESYRLKTKAGHKRIRLRTSRIRTVDELLTLLVIQDLSEVQQLTERLEHSLRLETVGRLSAGVAHEFNNLLTVINGYALLMQAELPATSPQRPLVEEIARAGERATAVTRQLLALGRKKLLRPVLLDLNQVINSIQTTLAPLLGADLDVVADLGPGPAVVRIDPAQIEQIVLNLAINARDAMPRGGTLRLTTSCITAPQEQAVSAKLPAGNFVRLEIRDNGIGISSAHASHIFEPFFTTKDVHTGTGLGLSMVHGAVQRCGGHIEVESSVDEGTSFTIYLPRCDEPVPAPRSGSKARRDGRGVETVLLVEDEAGVLRFMSKVLQDHGYQVVAASDATTGLAASRDHDGSIDLIVADISKVRMSGIELVQQIQHERSGSQLLCVTGNDDEIAEVVADKSMPLLRRPFSSQALVAAVRSTLDQAELQP